MRKTSTAKLNAKQFLQELAAFAEAQRKVIEAQVGGFAHDAAARAERLRRIEFNDFAFFCKTYFPHYFPGEPSRFHTWFMDSVPGAVTQRPGVWLAVSAPRGEGKSTLGTQVLALWCIVRELKHFMPVVMDSYDQAATMLEAIKVELESNPRLAADFPNACGGGKVWNAGTIVTANNIKLQAFGSGKKLRGLRHGPHRPDLVFLDDIENDENVRSPEQRDKLEGWLKKVILPLGPPDGSMSILYLNTLLHYDSVANRTHANPLWVSHIFRAIEQYPDRMELWQKWEELFINAGPAMADAYYAQNRVDMELGAVVSWPAMRPLLRLMQIRAADHYAFDCEYQNSPANQDAAYFPTLKFWVQPSRDWVFYGANDPSTGKNNKGRDPAAILVGGWDKNHSTLCVVEAAVARMVPDLQISTMIRLQREYHCVLWGVETIQFQAFFAQELVQKAALMGVPMPLRGIVSSGDKLLRIQALSPYVSSGLIQFSPKHRVLNDQLKYFPDAAHDDGPDALEMLWQLASKGQGGVPKIGSNWLSGSQGQRGWFAYT